MSPLVLLVPILLLATAGVLLVVRLRRLGRAARAATPQLEAVRSSHSAAQEAMHRVVTLLHEEMPPQIEALADTVPESPPLPDADRRKETRRRSHSPRARRPSPDPAPPTRP